MKYFTRFSFALCFTLLLSIPLTAPAQAQARQVDTFEFLRTEPATLFDIGIIYLRQRLDRVVNRYAQRNNALANGVVYPDIKERKVELAVSMTLAENLSCKDVRKALMWKFLNLDTESDAVEAAIEIFGNAFLHRGVESKRKRTVGIAMGRASVFTLDLNGTQCSGPFLR